MAATWVVVLVMSGALTVTSPTRPEPRMKKKSMDKSWVSGSMSARSAFRSRVM